MFAGARARVGAMLALRVVGRGERAGNAQRRRFFSSSRNAQHAAWWLPSIPIGAGLSLIAFVRLRALARESQRKEDPSVGAVLVALDPPWQLHLLLTLPLRSLSRLWGYVHNDFDIPRWLRPSLYSLYASIFACRLDEMKNTDLASYPNLGAFFSRELDLERCRPLDAAADMVSPCDGTITHWGVVASSGSIVHDVKGVGYKVAQLLGKKDMDIREHSHSQELHSPEQMLKINTIEYDLEELMGVVDSDNNVNQENINNQSESTALSKTVHNKIQKGLFFAVIYLAPGDYHRFHSPVDWLIKERRHIYGELLSVSPRLLNVVPELFTLNERVVLMGSWKYGLFSVIPVGATNVGSVKINFDQTLLTNRAKPNDHMSLQKYDPPVHSQRFDELGGFMLGSTVILVFEAPLERFVWSIDELQQKRATEGQSLAKGVRVKVGEGLGSCMSKKINVK